MMGKHERTGDIDCWGFHTERLDIFSVYFLNCLLHFFFSFKSSNKIYFNYLVHQFLHVNSPSIVDFFFLLLLLFY